MSDSGVRILQATCKSHLWIILLFACSTPGPKMTPFFGCEHPSTPGFTVGTGEGTFETIDPESQLPYVAGFQGGYHIWGSIRLSSPVEGEGELAFNVCQEGINIARVAFFDTLDAAQVEDENTLEYTGATVILLHDLRPDLVAGKPSILAARYIDADGSIFTDTVTFVPRCCTSITGEPSP